VRTYAADRLISVSRPRSRDRVSARRIHDSNYALAWNNALRRTLAALGVDPAAAGRAALDEPRRVEYIVVDPTRREADEKPRTPAAVEYEVVDVRG
jgi:hypothetical protein